MQATMELPKAFSIMHEYEFLPIQHLMARLNPRLVVKQVAKGVHVNGGGTVSWGLVYLDDEPPNKLKVENALREAGFDFAYNVLTDHSILADVAEVRANQSERISITTDRSLQDWEL